jgi:hypothetical protein
MFMAANTHQLPAIVNGALPDKSYLQCQDLKPQRLRSQTSHAD